MPRMGEKPGMSFGAAGSRSALDAYRGRDLPPHPFFRLLLVSATIGVLGLLMGLLPASAGAVQLEALTPPDGYTSYTNTPVNFAVQAEPGLAVYLRLCSDDRVYPDGTLMCSPQQISPRASDPTRYEYVLGNAVSPGPLYWQAAAFSPGGCSGAACTKTQTGVYTLNIVDPPPVPPPPPTAIFPAAGSEVEFGRNRVVFAWSKVGGWFLDKLEFAKGATPADADWKRVANSLTDAQYDDLNIPEEPGVDKAVLNKQLPPGEYAWRITNDGSFDTGEPRVGPPFQFSVVEPHLSSPPKVELQSEYGYGRKNPGVTLFNVGSEPYARVDFTATQGGRTVDHQRVNLDRGSSTSFIYRWRCKTAGETRFEITATDAYGKSFSEKERVGVPTCAQVIQRERRLQAEYEAELREFRRRCKRLGGHVVKSSGEQRCVRSSVVVIIIVVPRRS